MWHINHDRKVSLIKEKEPNQRKGGKRKQKANGREAKREGIGRKREKENIVEHDKMMVRRTGVDGGGREEEEEEEEEKGKEEHYGPE